MRIHAFIAPRLLTHALAASALWSASHLCAFGHQPYESGAVARIEGASLELEVTTSGEIAEMVVGMKLPGTLLSEGGNRAWKRAGSDLYEVRADGAVVEPDRVYFLPVNGEAQFRVIYDIGSAKELGLTASYFSKLPASYVGTLEVLDKQGLTIKSYSEVRGDSVVVAVSSIEEIRRRRSGNQGHLPPEPLRGELDLQHKVAIPLAILAVGWMLVGRCRKSAKSSIATGQVGMLAIGGFLALSPGANAQRQMESLGRGLIVHRKSATQVYIGWRLLGNDPSDLAFNIYRSANGGAAVKLNSSPIVTTTDFVDTPPGLGSTDYTYSVSTVIGGVEVADSWVNPVGSAPCDLPSNAPVRQYTPVPLQPTPDGNFRVKYCWVGDLDGDGEYDYVVDRWTESAINQQWIQAYKRDGTLLWQIALGPNSVDQDNVSPGSAAIDTGHNDGVTVYDMDGDGRAEVLVKTANGVVFNYGEPSQSTVTAANNEIQFISVVDGLTGNEVARDRIPVPSIWSNSGHVNGHFGILYCDGVRPSLIFHASNRNSDKTFSKFAATWDYRDGSLTRRWFWDTGTDPEPTAEGHQIRMADVDNDGRDEYVDVGHVLKADGSGQLNGDRLREIIHGDRFHVADIDPDHPGLETYLIQQTNPTGLTTVYHSSDRRVTLKKTYAGEVKDVGRGVVGPFVPGIYGLQFFSTEPGVFGRKGEQIYETRPWPVEAIWWDGDIAREFIDNDSFHIDKFGATGSSHIFNMGSSSAAPGGSYQAGSGKPAFWGDIVGDWREEVVAVANDNSELRIFTTTTADVGRGFDGSPVRIPTLMHDPQYRIQATTKGYVQSSYPSYYVGYGMAPLPPPPMMEEQLVWKGGAGSSTWDIGLTSSWLRDGSDSAYINGDTVRFDLSGEHGEPVVLDGLLQPGSLLVNSPQDYVLTGAGVLAGPMNLRGCLKNRQPVDFNLY